MEENNLKKAKMFNRKASKKKSKANKVIEILKIQKGYKIADIGSGGGYFTLRFAEKVSEKGHVFAFDINSEFLRYIDIQARQNGLKNITTIQIDDESPKFPVTKIDIIFLRNVYHHLSDRINYLHKLHKLLDKNGKIVIIEHNGSGYLNFNKLFGHFVDPNIIKNEMKNAGFLIENKYFFIKHQSFTIFKNKQN